METNKLFVNQIVKITTITKLDDGSDLFHDQFQNVPFLRRVAPSARADRETRDGNISGNI